MNEFVEPTSAENMPIEEVAATAFVAPGGGFSITVAQMNHALSHYHQMVPKTWEDADVHASQNGLMAACLSHALDWTVERGMEAMLHEVGFQSLMVVGREMYADFLARGLFDTATGRLS